MSDLYAKMISSTTNKGQKMTNEQLAQTILDRYTPFAFSCECKGEHIECREAMENPYLFGVMDTLRRVTDYIKDFDPTL